MQFYTIAVPATFTSHCHLQANLVISFTQSLISPSRPCNLISLYSLSLSLSKPAVATRPVERSSEQVSDMAVARPPPRPPWRRHDADPCLIPVLRSSSVASPGNSFPVITASNLLSSSARTELFGRVAAAWSSDARAPLPGSLC